MIDAEKEVLVSIIIPVYNSEKEISRCIDSVIKQSWSNLEIIVIDDGSSDNSGKICDRLCEQDKRIHVFHQSNLGVSHARNVGLKFAHGEYIVFMDSDDELPEESISVRVQGIEKVDLLVAGYEVIDSKNKKQYGIIQYDYQQSTQKEMFAMMFENSSHGYQGYLWNKIFRREIITKYDLKFQENIHYNEDRLFIVQYLKKIRQIKFINNSVYYYRINPNGAMQLVDTFSNTVYQKWITEFLAYRIMAAELKEYDSKIYYLCNLDAMRSAVEHRKKLPIVYRNEKKYFSKCIKEFSRTCILCGHVKLKQKIKLLGHYILGI